MVMMERFGSPTTRLMSVMKSFQVPVRSVQPGDRVFVITDDAMDPLVWQGAMAASWGFRAQISFSVGERKLMKHIVVKKRLTHKVNLQRKHR